MPMPFTDWLWFVAIPPARTPLLMVTPRFGAVLLFVMLVISLFSGPYVYRLRPTCARPYSLDERPVRPSEENANFARVSRHRPAFERERRPEKRSVGRPA